VSCTAEALVVTNARTQVMRFPLVRVARVVSSTDVVDWSGAALALCMRAGIGITWLDTHGQALGSLYAQPRNTASLATVLELWTERADGAQLYQRALNNGKPPNATTCTPASTRCTCPSPCATCALLTWRPSSTATA